MMEVDIVCECVCACFCMMVARVCLFVCGLAHVQTSVCYMDLFRLHVCIRVLGVVYAYVPCLCYANLRASCVLQVCHRVSACA